MKVFLSSTKIDLDPERQAVYDELASEYEVVRMEDFGSASEDALSRCLQAVAESQAYVLLLGHRYGSTVANTGLSYTQSEYEAARLAGVEVLAYVRAGFDDALASADDPVRLKDFRDQLEEAHWVDRPYFTSPEQLAAAVRRDVQRVADPISRRPFFRRDPRRVIRNPIAYAINVQKRAQLTLHPFPIVLVDLAAIDSDGYSDEDRRRVQVKVNQIRRSVEATGANIIVLNDLPAYDASAADQRVDEAKEAASAIVCIVQGAADADQFDRFDGATGHVAVWHPGRVTFEGKKVDGVLYVPYSDQDLHSCQLALKVQNYLASLIDRHLVETLAKT
jgi:Domain of unknown function (DUF4062)